MIGWGLITNFHGFADKFSYAGYSSSSRLRRVPPWKWMHRRTDEEELASRKKLSRLIAVPFAILGPIVTIVGVVQMARGHIAVPRGPALPLPFGLAFIGMSVAFMVQYWRRGGFFRLSAQQGGWMRAASIVATLGAVSFGVFTALGFTTLGIGGWMVGGLASVSLLMSRRSALTMPPAPAPTQPGGQPPPADPDEDDDTAAYRWL